MHNVLISEIWLPVQYTVVVYSTSHAVQDSANDVGHVNWTKCSTVNYFLPFELGALNKVSQSCSIGQYCLQEIKESRNITNMRRKIILSLVETFT